MAIEQSPAQVGAGALLRMTYLSGHLDRRDIQRLQLIVRTVVVALARPRRIEESKKSRLRLAGARGGFCLGGAP